MASPVAATPAGLLRVTEVGTWSSGVARRRASEGEGSPCHSRGRVSRSTTSSRPAWVRKRSSGWRENSGSRAVEIRNDLEGNAILDGTPAWQIRDLAERAGIRVLSINALQRFNAWGPEREAEAVVLADYARACGAEAVVLVPTNDGTPPDGLAEALEGLAPILGGRGLVGLVEPLGFAPSAVRLKSEAAKAIAAVGGDVFRITHDTFHHHLAGEAAVFPALTGLVHISGVDDPALTVEEMRDAHRVLVTEDDRLGNVAQIRGLFAAGYDGFLSFEPFAVEVQTLADPADAIRRSMDVVRQGLGHAT